jgi:hypothetical protein
MDEPSFEDRFRIERNPSERFVPAVILIAVGVIFFLNNLQILAIHDILQYWPAIFVALGIVQLVDSGSSAGRSMGGVLVVVGGYMLAHNLGFLPALHWRDVWPLLLIGLGILLLFDRAVLHTGRLRAHRHFAGLKTKFPRNDAAVFGGGKRSFNGREFTGGHYDAVMGGYEIDLRGAMMPGDSATLEMNAVLGGAEIRVPSDWVAVVSGTGVFGAFIDNTVAPNPMVTPNPKRLFVKGSAVFGGVEVKN